MDIVIYTQSGTERFRTPINEGAKRKCELMKEDYITLPFNVLSGIFFEIGDWCDIDLGDENAAVNGRFIVRSIQKPTYDTATGAYKYELQMDAWYYEWANKLLKYSPKYGGMEASFSLTANLQTHLSVFLSNLTYHNFTYKGTAITVLIESTASEAESVKLISYNNINLIDALTQIAESFDCEWWITDNVIHFGRCHLGGAPYIFSLGTNCEDMTAADSKTEYFTRLLAFGSSRNIPTGYYKLDDDADVVKTAVVEQRLRLPKSKCPGGYYNVPGTTDKNAIEGMVIFDDIYPRTNISITEIQTYQAETEDGDDAEDSDDTDTGEEDNDDTDTGEEDGGDADTGEEDGDGTDTSDGEFFYLCYYDFDTFPFLADDDDESQDYRIAGQDLTMTFTGNSQLSGLSFVAQWHKPGQKVGDLTIPEGKYCFEIIANEDYGIKLPNTILKPSVGDTFSLTGWDSSKLSDLGLIGKAEQELYDATVSYSNKTKIDPNTYTCTLFSDYAYGLNSDGKLDKSYWQQYELGTPVTLVNSAFFAEGSRASRIIGYELNIDIPYDSPVYTVGEKTGYSRLSNVEETVKEIQMNGVSYSSVKGTGGTSVYVIKTNDSTSPTDNNVYSAKRSKKDFLSKVSRDTAMRQITFNDGLEVGSFTNMSGGSFIPDELGRSYLEVDRLKVRMKAYFETLEIQEVNTVGGKIILSPAGAVRLVSVDDNHTITVTERIPQKDEDGNDVFDEDGNQIFDVIEKEVDNNIPAGIWRCYFLAEQDGVEIENKWQVGDQAMSKTFNVSAGIHHQVSNHYYWALVSGVSDTDTITVTDGIKYHWIDISKTDTDTDSDAPMAGDVVAQLGNRTDTTRQNALIFSAVDIYSPSITLYHGIDSYSLLNKEYVEYGVNKTTDKAFFNIFGETYVGDRRDGNEQEYMKYEDGHVEISGQLHIKGGSTINGNPLDDYMIDITDVTNLIEGIKDDLQKQIDGAIETWFADGKPTLTNYPASSWTDEATRNLHIGDLYYDRQTGKAYRFFLEADVYAWYEITDTDIQSALEAASNAQYTADGKMKVFSKQPGLSDDYDVGDLWVNATYPSDGSLYKNDILRANTRKDAGVAFNISHWGLASRYTDDSSLETFKVEYQQTVQIINTQLDKKAETWYQSTDPALSWLTASVRSEHAGDLWYNTTNGKTYYYDGTAWQFQDIPLEVFDKIDGKASIYVSKPNSYMINDLWILESTYTLSGVSYSKGELVTATASSNVFNSSHWTKKVKYTDDTLAQEAIEKIDNAKTLLDNLNTSVTNFKTEYDTFVSDGVITIAEGEDIKKSLTDLTSLYNAVKQEYNSIISSVYLKDYTQLPSLQNSFTAFESAFNEIKTLIETIGDGKVTQDQIVAFEIKINNFSDKYETLWQYLSSAQRYIEDYIYQHAADAALLRIGNIEYVAKALKNDTSIEGGLILSSLIALRDSEGNVWSGMNGIYQNDKTLAAWYGGPMVDKFALTSEELASGVQYAASAIRMDGSGYLADGAIYWGTDGLLHADANSFIINENQIGDYLRLFHIQYKTGTKEVQFVTPQYPFETLKVNEVFKINPGYVGMSSGFQLGADVTSGVTAENYAGMRFVWEPSTHTLHIESVDGKAANFYATGGVSALGAGSGGSGGGGGAIDTVYDYNDLGNTFDNTVLSDTFNAYTINRLAARLSAVESGALTSVSWDVISNKPAWIGSTKPTYSYSEITGAPTSLANPYALTVQRHGVSVGTYDGSAAKTINIAAPAFSEVTSKPTTLAGYGITDAKISGGVITLGGTTITPLTSHQSLANYVTLNTAQTITANKTFSAQILKDAANCYWVNGRSNALVRLSSYSGYTPLTSLKTSDGSWEMGVYTNNVLYFTYITDTNFNAGTNTATAQITMSSGAALGAASFVKAGGTVSQLLVANGSVVTKKTLSAVSSTGWTNNTTDDLIVPTMSFMAYWNGAYSSAGASNLTYCKHGAFGNVVTHAHTDYVTSVGVSGNTLTWAKGGVSQTAITVPYATSASQLYTSCTINGTSFNGTANITTANWGTARNISIADATAAHTGTAVSVNGSANVTLKLPSTITAALSGNATTATTLQTSRTLWGQSFNGSANVSGDMTGVGNITASGTVTIQKELIVWQSAYIANGYNLSFYDTNSTVRMALGFNSANTLHLGYGTAGAGYNTQIYGNQIYFYHGSSRTNSMTLNASGDLVLANGIRIGGTSGIRLSYDSTNKALKIEGNVYATGGVTALKTS